MTLEEAKAELEKFVKLKTTMRPAFVQPLLDAVEVVRCKDCKWWNGKKETCIEIGGLWRASDFCSWGERREDGNTD